VSVVEDGAVDASATFVFDDPSFDSKACRVNVNVDDLG
jgi:hypothetical protein